MSTSIFYFSGTGNSLKVSRDLANELGGAQIFSIPKAINSDTGLDADTIGVVFPVYMFGPPLIVAEFLKKIKPGKNKYIFALATYGGKAGNTLGYIEGLLKANGINLNAGFLVKMPGNYTPLYEAIPQDKQAAMFKQEADSIKEIAGIIKERVSCKVEKDAPVLRWLLSLVYRKMSPKIPFLDKDFWADQRCTHCGVCQKLCPVNNIKLFEGRPRWFHKCEQCFACLHWCPVEAIQYSSRTQGRKRYRNPDVSLEDLLASK